MARNSRKAQSKIKRKHSQSKSRLPRTAEEYKAKSKRFKDAYGRSMKVYSKMKIENKTLTEAAREVGVSRDTVIRWAGSALNKDASGRYTAKQRDYLLRMIRILTQDGEKIVAVKGWRQVSIIGKHWAAVVKFWTRGDPSGLEKLLNATIKDASGTTIALVTDLRQLRELARRETTLFESIYKDYLV